MNKTFWKEATYEGSGRHELRLDDMGDDMVLLSVSDVSIAYSYAYRKPDCKYELNFCNFGYSKHLKMRAETLEEAKAEAVIWIRNEIQGLINSYRNRVIDLESLFKKIK